MSDPMDELIRLSEELGLYDPKLHICEVCNKENGFLTRVAVTNSDVSNKYHSLVLCDGCYLIQFGYTRN